MLIFVIISLLCHSTTAVSEKKLPCGKNCTCTYSWDEEVKIKADCSLKGLNAVPLDLPSNITDLNLSWNSINLQSSPNLPMCKAYVNLSTLSFAWNSIERLSPMFEDCNKLTELDLTGNVLQNVNSRTFQGLGSLKQMKGLEVLDIDVNTFKSLVSLDKLNLSYHGSIQNLLMLKDLNLLTELELYYEKLGHPDPKFFHFERNTLKILKLNSPLVKVFPLKLLNELKSLEYFSLNAPSLLTFNVTKEGKPLQLKKLEIFNVRRITPDLKKSFSQLEVLRLYKIRSPDALILPPTIKELEVVDCALKKLPQNWLFSLASLEKLSLSGNPIEYINPMDFSNMKSMKYLDLSGTMIPELPSKFLEPLKDSLQQFVMVHGDLRNLSHNAISDMLVLKVIDLSFNFIEIIEEGNFKNMPLLTTLNLQNNYLVQNSVSEDWYSTSPNLREINLSNNNLNGFPVTLLGSNMSVLGLKGSNITTVPVINLCDKGSLSKLDLEDNPVHCDKSTEMLLGCLPGIDVIGNCETPLAVHSCRISELTSCLSKLGTSPLAPPLLVIESSSTPEPPSDSPKKWLMGIVQEETEATAIIRPIITLPYALTESTDDSKLLSKVTEAPSSLKSSNVVEHKSFDHTITKNLAAEEVEDLLIHPAANVEVKNVLPGVLEKHINNREENDHTTERLELVFANNSTMHIENKKSLTQLDAVVERNTINFLNKTENDSLGPATVNQSIILENSLTVSSEIKFNKPELEAMELANETKSIERGLSNLSSEIVSDLMSNKSFISIKKSNASYIETNKESPLSVTSRVISTQSVIEKQTMLVSRFDVPSVTSNNSNINNVAVQPMLVSRFDVPSVTSNNSNINNVAVQRNENTNYSISEEKENYVVVSTPNVTKPVNSVNLRLELVVTNNSTMQIENKKSLTQLDAVVERNTINFSNTTENDSLGPATVNQSGILENPLTVSSEIKLKKTEIEAMELANETISVERGLSNVSFEIVSDLMSNKSFISIKKSNASYIETNKESLLSVTSRVISTQSVIEKQTMLASRFDVPSVTSNNSNINNVAVQRNENTNYSISEEKENYVVISTSNVTKPVNSVNYDYKGKNFDIDSLNLTSVKPISHLSASDVTQKHTITSEMLSILLNSNLKEELILKNDSEAKDSINHLIKPAKGTDKPEDEMKNTMTESVNKPTPDSGDIDPWLSPDIWNSERILDNFNAIQTKLPGSIDSSTGSQLNKQVLKPVYIKAAKPKEEETFASFSSLVATAVVVVVLLAILGGGFWWFKKYWQTGTYNAAATTGYQGHVDEVNISLSSMNKLA